MHAMHFFICQAPQGGDVSMQFKGIEIKLLQWAWHYFNAAQIEWMPRM